MEHEGDDDNHCNWFARYSQQKIGTRIRGIGNKRTSGDYPNYSIIKIGHNTEKSPGDLRRLAVTQTPVENHLLTLIGKNNNNNNNNSRLCGDREETIHHIISECSKLAQKE